MASNFFLLVFTFSWHHLFL